MNNVLLRLTIRNMRANKKRTMITWIGTIISVAMVTAVLVSFSSFTGIMKRDAEKKNGLWNVYLQTEQEGLYQSLEKDEAVSRWVAVSQAEAAFLPENESNTRSHIRFVNLSGDAADLCAISVLEGRMPQSEGEIAVTQLQMEYSGVNWQVGDTVTLPTASMEEVYDETTDLVDVEKLQASEPKTYTVVGIVDGGIFSPSWNSYYTVFTQDHSIDAENAGVYVQLKDPSQAYEWGERLSEKYEGHIQYNYSLLMFYGASDDGQLIGFFGSVLAMIFAIIFIGAVSLIYNAFAISLTQRSRQLGLLAATGATKGQLRSSVFFEALITSAVCIPLGFLSGCAGIGIVFWALDSAMRQVMGIQFSPFISVPWAAALWTGLISLAMIFASALIPAWRAGRINPIDAVRGAGDIKIKPRYVRTKRLVRKIFGFDAELALKNIKRNHSRYLATLFSLVVSIVLFLSAATFAQILSYSYQMASPPVDYNISFGIYTNGAYPEKEVQQAEALARPGDTVGVREKVELTAAVSLSMDQISQPLQDILKQEGYLDESASGSTLFFVDLYAVEDETYLEWTGHKQVPEIEFAQDGKNPIYPVVLCNRYTVKQENAYTEVTGTRLSEGDVLTLIEDGTGGMTYPAFRVSGVTDKMPSYVSSTFDAPNTMVLVLPRSVVEGLFTFLWDQVPDLEQDVYIPSRSVEVLYQTEDIKEMEKSLEVLQDQMDGVSGTSIINVGSYYAMQRQTLMILLTFLFGFVALIVLVCTANIFNTISTGMALRVRELAMLRSVGMSLKSMRKMIRFESLFYGIKALLWGLPISFLVMMWEYNSFGERFKFGAGIPWHMVAAATVGIFVITGAACLYASRKLRSMSILESLRRDAV